jgi:hypothetical protein
MIRAVMYLLGALLAITLVRMVIGLIGKTVGNWMRGPAPGRERGERVPLQGELKKCAVCGVYAPPASQLERGAEVLHFCSPACREKYTA